MLRFIQKLPAKKQASGKWKSFSLFECSNCMERVKREPHQAKRMKSCGCLWMAGRLKHGGILHGKKTNIYSRWAGIRDRILNTNCKAYPLYGGRGIKLCSEWNSFAAFREWAISHGYKKELHIDRINVNGDYEPRNCRWVTPQENTHNRRVTKLSYAITHGLKILKNAGMSVSDIQRLCNSKLGAGSISQILSGKIWMERR